MAKANRPWAAGKEEQHTKTPNTHSTLTTRQDGNRRMGKTGSRAQVNCNNLPFGLAQEDARMRKIGREIGCRSARKKTTTNETTQPLCSAVDSRLDRPRLSGSGPLVSVSVGCCRRPPGGHFRRRTNTPTRCTVVCVGVVHFHVSLISIIASCSSRKHNMMSRCNRLPNSQPRP